MLKSEQKADPGFIDLKGTEPPAAEDRPWYYLDAIGASEADLLARGEVSERIKAMVKWMQDPRAVRSSLS